MEYSILRSLIGANGCKSFAMSIDVDTKEIPIIEYIKEALEDYSLERNNATKEDVLRLYNLCNKVYILYMSGVYNEKDIKKFIQVSSYCEFSIDLGNYVREPTINEIKNGVPELVSNKKYIINREKEVEAYLLLWAKTGKLRYYTLAGFNYKTNVKDKQICDESYILLSNVLDKYEKAIEWWKSEDRHRDIEIATKQYKKVAKYNYPNYAEDEIQVVPSVKTMIYQLNITKRDFDLKEYDIDNYKLNRLLYLQHKRTKPINHTKYFNENLEPYEIVELREIYNELFPDGYEVGYSEMVRKKKEKAEKAVSPLQLDCEQILDAKKEGKFTGDEFVFKIIDTMKKIKYAKCSDKQRAIIDEALKKISVNTENKKVEPVEPKVVDKEAEQLENLFLQDSFDTFLDFDGEDVFQL